MQISVIIPAYKAERYIAQTIESVLGQTMAPFEIIVVDDGSPDRSGEIAASYPAVRVFRQANQGVSAARNRGASLATGTWLAFLDQDDLWEPNYLESVAASIMTDTEVVYTGRRHLIESGDGFALREPEPAPPEPKALREVLLDRCPFQPSMVCLTRRAFDQIGGFDGRFNTAEDWHLWLRLTRVTDRFVRVAEPLVQYRIHAAANTNNPLPVLARSIAVVQDQIVPHVSAGHARSVISRLQGEAGILLRENGQRGALGMVLRSIAHHPFHEPRRYRIAAHMLWREFRSRVRAVRDAVSSFLSRALAPQPS